MPKTNGPLTLFEESWREWSRRPPRRSPREASLRVANAVRSHRPRRLSRWTVTAAAAATIAVAAGILFTTIREPAPPTPAGLAAETVALQEGVVLVWLDESTPLYMTFQPGAVNGGG